MQLPLLSKLSLYIKYDVKNSRNNCDGDCYQSIKYVSIDRARFATTRRKGANPKECTEGVYLRD